MNFALPPEGRPPATPQDRTADRQNAAARWTFIGLAVALLPPMIWASFDFGVTWDEKSRHRYGEFIWMFYRGTRARSAFGETGGHLYGGLFDVICAGVEQWVPFNRYIIRHVINAIFGWVGIVYAGRLAGRLFGHWAGVLGLVLLAASPRFFADSMNNPKDAPFAAMVMVSLYYISTVSPRWPYLPPSTAAKISMALAAALDIRVGALMYFGYLGLLLIAYGVAARDFNWRHLADTGGRLTLMLAAILLLGTLCWPWAQGSPFVRPFIALFGVANFGWGGSVVYRGAVIDADRLPWHYVPWWLIISTPPVVLAGIVLTGIMKPPRGTAFATAALWFTALFPPVTAFLMHSTLYDGVRHLEFIYPILAVLSAAGWASAFAATRPLWLRRAAAAALAAGVAGILYVDVTLHPNQAVYFNTLVGGPRGASARYDMDYWGNCVLESVRWTAEQARRSGVPVTVSGNPDHLVQLDAERFKELAFNLERRQRHYFTIRLSRGSIGGMQELAAAPSLHRVETPDGALLCSVQAGPAYREFEELQARMRRTSDDAANR